jgi:PAS domain S-box-containing protein
METEERAIGVAVDVTDRKERERKLETTRNRFRSLTENTALGILTIDAESTVRYANDAVEELFGYAPDELVGESLATVIPDGLEERHFAAIERYLDSGDRRLDWEWTELPAHHRDGREVPIGVSFGEYVVDGERRFTGVVRDITERKKRERELERQKELFEKTFEQSNDAIFLLDPANEAIQRVNDRACEMLGYAREELTSLSPEAIHPEDMEQFTAFVEGVIADGEGWTDELTCRTKGGRLLPTEFSASTLEIDDRTHMLASVRDISDRKERERELEERTTAIAAATDGIAILDANGEYTYVNQAHADVYGYDDPETFLGEGWQMCYAAEDVAAFEAEVMPALDRDGRWRGEATGERRDGTQFPQELTLTALSDGRLVCVVRNITERKERQRELERNADLLSRTQELASVGGWELDLRDDELRWTDEVKRIHGLGLDYEPDLDEAMEFYHPEDAPLVEEAVERAIAEGEPFDLECRLRTAADELRWVRARGEPQREGGETVVLRGAFQDITERKRTEERLRTLHEGTREMMAASTRREICETAVETSEHVLGHSITVVRLLADDGETLVPVAQTDETGERPAYPVGDTPAGRTYREGMSRLYDDLADLDSDELADDYDRASARSAMYVPLGTHGVVSIADTAVDRFDRSDLALAQVLAANAEAALDRVDHERSLEALHEGTRAMMDAETPEEVAELAVETARDALGLSLTGCWLYDPDDVRLRPTAFTDECHALFDEFPTYTAGNSLSWEAFATGEAAVYDDVGSQPGAYNTDSPIASEIIVPLGDHGILNNASTDPETFEASDVSAARILAANVEAALERAEREMLLRDRETQLERERDRFASLFENVPDPSVVVEIHDDEPITKSVNAAFEDVFGYEPETVVGRSLNDLIVPPEHTDEAREIDRTVRGGNDIVREVRRRTASGEVRDFLFRNVSIDRTDEYEAFGIYTDITERREAEQFRRWLYEVVSDSDLTADERVRALLDLGRERLGMEIGYLTRIEAGTQRIVEACGTHEEIQPGDECPLPQSYCRKTVDSDGPMTLRHAAETDWEDDPAYEAFGLEAYVGSKVSVNGELYGAVYFADREPQDEGFSTVELAFADLVTRGIASELERRRHERALEAQKHKIERLHAVATNLVSCETEAEVYELTVDAAERILDLYLCYVGIVEGDSIVPKARSSRAGPEHVREMDIEEGTAGKTLRSGTSRLVEDVGATDAAEPVREEYRSAISVPIGDFGVFQAVSTDKDEFDAEDLELAETLVAHVVATVERVRRERELERGREELERQNDRLEEFASVVSHDLRNPLGVAQGYLEMVRESGAEEDFAKIDRAHDRMEAIIEDVLTLARQGRTVGDTHSVSLADVVETAWSAVETTDTELTIEEDLGTIEADESRLRELFENLFRNAIEHGGEDVTVRVGELANERGFFVEDGGPGIPADEREQVFDHGFSTSEEGTGFGLPIVRRIAEAHDWNTTVSEGESGGARFEIDV